MLNEAIFAIPRFELAPLESSCHTIIIASRTIEREKRLISSLEGLLTSYHRQQTCTLTSGACVVELTASPRT
jgi:glutamyl-tRNA reductase